MNELRYKDFNFSVLLKYKMHHTSNSFFPAYVLTDQITIDLKETGKETYQATTDLPFGSLEVLKILFFDKENVTRETFDFSKNKILVEMFPEPLLLKEKEQIIRNKESLMREKEISLKKSIKQIEEQKFQEEQRLKELEEFLANIPYSLEEIFDYCSLELLDARKDLINIFAFLESEEYKYFKKIYQIFQSYAKFYDEDKNPCLDIESLMHFYRSYFNPERDELSSIVNDFQKYFHSRYDEKNELNFMEFVHVIIYLLYNIQIYRSIRIENEFKAICELFDKRVETELTFRTCYHDEMAGMIINANIQNLKKLFLEKSFKKFDNYSEMSNQLFLQLAKDISDKKGYDFLNLTKDLKFLDSLNFFDFLEKTVQMALNIDETENDSASKLDTFFSSFL